MPEPTTLEDRAHEQRVRRLATREGLKLVKSRARNCLDPTYGTYGLVDPDSNTWVSYAGGYGYGLNLDEISAGFARTSGALDR